LARQSWLEKERLVDVFDVKSDVIKSLVEAGYNKDKLYIDDENAKLLSPWKIRKNIS
jgi:phenylalanyl-tRNA synthetase beta chain